MWEIALLVSKQDLCTISDLVLQTLLISKIT